MVMSWIFTVLLLISLTFAFLTGRGSELAAAVLQGAQAGVTLAISMAGAICLWCGMGNLMERTGITDRLCRILGPLLHRLFPEAETDPGLDHALSANFCANLLGLGNAATPMGISAAKRMVRDHSATDGLCRLVVLNTASIQLIPASVAAIRTGLGCETPFDILPAVWITSFCSAALGLLAARLLGKVWKDD